MSEEEWHDKAVNGALQKALAVMVLRQGKQEEAEAALRARVAELEAALVEATLAEREACAKHIDGWAGKPTILAAAIRARAALSQTPDAEKGEKL